MSLLDEVARHRSDIETDTYTATWKELLGQYADGDLRINPDYQRLFRWDSDQQTQYIESLILGIPSPPVFLAQNADEKFEVIDGLQRISTLLKFFAHERNPGTNPAPLDPEDVDADLTQNDITKSTVLMKGRILPSLETGTAVTLPETIVRGIRYSRITIILIEKGSKTDARYEVFRRLNRSGSLLSDQEIRNCTARILGPDFPDLLRRWAKEPLIRSVLSVSEDSRRKMGVEEALLRMLAFNFNQKPLNHEIREYLDEFMEFASRGLFTVSSETERRLFYSFDLIQKAFPEGTAFRLKNQGFSTNLFDVVATGVFRNAATLTADKLRVRHGELLESPELKTLIGAGSNTRKKLEGRLQLGLKWFGA